MSYTTLAEMETRFGTAELAELTDRVSGEVPDAEVIGRAIADAEAEIDGYLAARYSVPLINVPPLIARLASDLARYFLCGARANELERARYADAVKTLRAIGKGEMILDAGTVPAGGVGLNEACVTAPSRPRAFGREA